MCDLLLHLETCSLRWLSTTAAAVLHWIQWGVPNLKGPFGTDPGERHIYFL